MSALSPPVARAHMLIRRPASQVYGAFIDPAVTSRFWFTRGSGKLVRGDKITWHWDMYGFSAQVDVRELEQDRRILIGWPTPVEWLLSPRGGDATFVTITASGFTGTDDEQVAAAIDSMGGFSFVLAGCKAWLEHGVRLDLVGDHDPDRHVSRGA
ncbi:SRPBCC family protein [Tahibacter sp. UC22_41]|uniref:SRPBCC family protein n=1 Tax=Tahibacter sp. UC22_41 TaxID=3350178 RepID=UPI0036DD3C12